MSAVFLAQLARHRLPKPEMEYRFHPVRRFRWDYAWPAERVALEVMGGVWFKSGHSSGTGLTRDYEKFSLGARTGWRILLVQPRQLATEETIAMIRDALAWEAK